MTLACFCGVKGPVTEKAVFATYPSKKKKQRRKTGAEMEHHTLYINSQYVDRYIDI